jgi:hypothetical protein
MELVFIDTSSRHLRDASAPNSLSTNQRRHLKSEKMGPTVLVNPQALVILSASEGSGLGRGCGLDCAVVSPAVPGCVTSFSMTDMHGFPREDQLHTRAMGN